MMAPSEVECQAVPGSVGLLVKLKYSFKYSIMMIGDTKKDLRGEYARESIAK
jgi:hypothetical protein